MGEVENPARNERLYHLLIRRGNQGHLRVFAKKVKQKGIQTVGDYLDYGEDKIFAEIKTVPANRKRVRAILAELGLPGYAIQAPKTPAAS
jgi:hypothetical protein